MRGAMSRPMELALKRTMLVAKALLMCSTAAYLMALSSAPRAMPPQLLRLDASSVTVLFARLEKMVSRVYRKKDRRSGTVEKSYQQSAPPTQLFCVKGALLRAGQRWDRALRY